MLIFIPVRFTSSEFRYLLLFNNLFLAIAKEKAERRQPTKLYRFCTFIKISSQNLLIPLTSEKLNEKKKSVIKSNSV